jgi:hypothetical protein
MKAEPFEIAIPQETLDDLHDRLARRRASAFSRRKWY